MALFEFKLADMGEGVTEGEVVAWHVKPGDRVAEDEPVVEVMTDKATVVIGAPRAGKIVDLRAAVGETVHVGDVLAVIDTGNGVKVQAEVSESGMTSLAGAVQGTSPAGTATRVEVAPAPRAGGETAGAAGTAKQSEPVGGEKALATPATRALARKLGVDLGEVARSKGGNRVTSEDVKAWAERRQAAAGAAGPEAGPAGPPQESRPGERRIPFAGVRRRIAERLQQAKNTAAHVTFVEECEADRLIEACDRLRPEAEQQGVELTYLAFIVKATVAALKKHPYLNCSLDEAAGELVMHDYYNIGIATATEQGLLVPVVKEAQKLDLLQTASEIQRLAAGARQSELSAAELTGSTFTVSSLGKVGGLLATPLINLPNVAIMSVHRIKQRPVVRQEKIEIGNVMLLALSFDHRIVDGQQAALFTCEVVEQLQNPERSLRNES
jgi:pyruvate dehydrogenase E2 component (dihydrolipoamide acetyltransferase)